MNKKIIRFQNVSMLTFIFKFYYLLDAIASHALVMSVSQSVSHQQTKFQLSWWPAVSLKYIKYIHPSIHDSHDGHDGHDGHDAHDAHDGHDGKFLTHVWVLFLYILLLGFI